MNTIPRKLLLGLAVAGTLLVSACGDPAVPKSDVEGKITSSDFDDGGGRADSASCPGDLTGVVGTTMSCTATRNGSSNTVVVTVTSVADGKVGVGLKLG